MSTKLRYQTEQNSDCLSLRAVDKHVVRSCGSQLLLSVGDHSQHAFAVVVPLGDLVLSRLQYLLQTSSTVDRRLLARGAIGSAYSLGLVMSPHHVHVICLYSRSLFAVTGTRRGTTLCNGTKLCYC